MQIIPIEENDVLRRVAFGAPVSLTEKNEEIAIILSKSDYDRLRGDNADRLRQYCDEVSREAAANGMTEEILKDILSDDS